MQSLRSCRRRDVPGRKKATSIGDGRVSRRHVWNLSKYVLAFGLLAFVIWRNWDPAPPSSPAGEEAAQGTGLKYVWERHVVQGEPVHYGFFAAACFIYFVAILLTLGRWYLLVRAVGLPFTPANAIRLGMIGI